MQETKRIEYIDALKGFAILLMVMGHSLSWNFDNYSSLFNNENPSQEFLKATLIHDFIYAFHMPLFFLVSGYFMNIKRGILGTVLSKTKRLLIPYIVTGFFLLFLRNYYGYWFLFSLWEVSIMSIPFLYLITNANFKWKNIYVELLLAFAYWYILCKISRLECFKSSYFDIEKGFNFCYFYLFLMGAIMRKYAILDNCLLVDWGGRFLLTFLALFGIRYLPDYGMISTFMEKIRVFMLPIFGSLFFVSVFKSGIPHKLNQFFSFLGRYTLEIYIIHIFFVIQIPELGSFWIRTNIETCMATQFLYALITSIVAIFISLFIAYFLHKSNILRLLLFGA